MTERDPRCTCDLVRRAIVPEEHNESCPVVDDVWERLTSAAIPDKMSEGSEDTDDDLALSPCDR